MQIYVYDNGSKTYNKSDTLADHSGAVKSVVLSTDGTWLTSAGDDQRVLIYKWNGTGYAKFTDTILKAQAISDLSVSGDGSLLSITYAADQNVVTNILFQYGIDCSNDTYSHGTRANPTSCSCKDRFIWSVGFEKCAINC